MPAGRPTDYREDYARMAEVACEDGGFSDLKLAKLFGVAKSTINNWKKDHPEFLDSIKKGKEAHDTERVRGSLLKRATGFAYTETTKEPMLVRDPETKEVTGTKLQVTKRVRKTVAPETAACAIWLFNRDRKNWTNPRNIQPPVNENKPEPVKIEFIEEDASGDADS